MMSKFPLTTYLVFKYLEGDEEHHYLPLFDDHTEGKSMSLASYAIVGLKIEREDMLWVDIKFETEAPTKCP